MKALDIITEQYENEKDERTKRQFQSIIKWLHNKAQGTIQATTGLGKTRIALEAIKLFKRNDNDRKVIVIVPTIPLKEQWKKLLIDWEVDNNSEVYVINSAVKDYRDTDLLIIDEIHRMASKTFKAIFDVVNYKFLLGLTATFERLDGKHSILSKYAPIVDDIPLRLVRAKGWSAPYRHYNLGVTMSAEEKAVYERMSDTFNAAMDKFGRDFQLMKSSSYKLEPFINKQNIPFDSYAAQYARRLGWKGNAADKAYNIFMNNKSKPVKERESIWGNDEHQFSPKRLYVWAIIGMRAMIQIKNYIYTNQTKINTAIELINSFDRRTITFSQNISTITKIKNHFENICVEYHSDMKPIYRDVLQEKEYKTIKGANKWIDKHPDWKLKEKHGKIYVQSYKKTKISANVLRKEALHKIKNYKNIKIIASGKALNEGVDIPNLEMGITISRDSSKLRAVQTAGRIFRKHTKKDGKEKDAIFVDIYLKDTKDEYWLKKSQQGMLGIKWVDSINDIIDNENKLNQSKKVNSYEKV
jgi:superfamily II DNA or RNA helicase